VYKHGIITWSTPSQGSMYTPPTERLQTDRMPSRNTLFVLELSRTLHIGRSVYFYLLQHVLWAINYVNVTGEIGYLGSPWIRIASCVDSMRQRWRHHTVKRIQDVCREVNSFFNSILFSHIVSIVSRNHTPKWGEPRPKATQYMTDGSSLPLWEFVG
jgi:hypothetical protein